MSGVHLNSINSMGYRILHVTSSVSLQKGGVSEAIVQLSAAASNFGCSSDVVCLDSPEQEALQTLPFRTIALGPAWRNYGFSLKLAAWLMENVRNYDGIILHGLWQFPGLALLWASRLNDVRYYVFPHGMLDIWFKRRYPWKHLKKLPYWILAEREILANARAVFFTTEAERMRGRGSFPFYGAREVVLGFGIARPPETAVASNLEPVSLGSNRAAERRLLFLGRVDPKKGPDLLIKAFAAFKRQRPQVADAVRLVFAGPVAPEYFRKLSALALEEGVADDILWLGMLRGSAKWAAFRSAEAFILPSHQENFGVAVVEALASGTPVLISTEVNIAPEIAADGAGLVRPNTYAGTLSLLLTWFDLCEEERNLFAKRALDCFNQRFLIDNTSKRLLERLSLDLQLKRLGTCVV